MKMTHLALPLILALGLTQAAIASPQDQPGRSPAIAQLPADLPVAQIAQAQDPAPAPAPAQDSSRLDVNVDVDRGGGTTVWYASPIWIAIFVLGGLLVLVLLAMAARGGSSSSAPAGTTIVK